MIIVHVLLMMLLTEQANTNVRDDLFVNPLQEGEHFNYVPSRNQDKSLSISYWLRCYGGKTTTISAILRNGSDREQTIPRQALPWSNSTKITISIFDFENVRTIAKTSGWIDEQIGDISIPPRTSIGCTVPFSRLFPTVDLSADPKDLFLNSDYELYGKQYKSGFMIMGCRELPATKVLESMCPK